MKIYNNFVNIAHVLVIRLINAVKSMASRMIDWKLWRRMHPKNLIHNLSLNRKTNDEKVHDYESLHLEYNQENLDWRRGQSHFWGVNSKWRRKWRQWQ